MIIVFNIIVIDGIGGEYKLHGQQELAIVREIRDLHENDQYLHCKL